ncbi:MAG: hypothetical protein R3F47_07405 [Gammaproteobacteria bacterium]
MRTLQLNSFYDYDGIEDIQIRTWNHIGLFTSNIGRADRYNAHASLEDTSASLESRSRAYLDSNCAFCHTPGGGTPVSLNLNSNVALSSMNAVDVVPSAGDLGIADARIIAPGDHTRSMLWERMHTSDSVTRMPPIASVMPDETALDILAQWIDSL